MSSYYKLLIGLCLLSSPALGLSIFNDDKASPFDSKPFTLLCPGSANVIIPYQTAVDNLNVTPSCKYTLLSQGIENCTPELPCAFYPGELSQNAVYLVSTFTNYSGTGPGDVLYYYGGINIENETEWVVDISIENGNTQLQKKSLSGKGTYQYAGEDLNNLSTVTVITHAIAVGAPTYTLNCITYPSQYDASYGGPLTITAHNSPPTAYNCTLVSSTVDSESVKPSEKAPPLPKK